MHFHAIPTAEVTSLRQGGFDINGQKAERAISDGIGKP